MSRHTFKFGRRIPKPLPPEPVLPALYTGEYPDHKELSTPMYVGKYHSPGIADKCRMTLYNMEHPENYEGYYVMFDTSEGWYFLLFYGEADITSTHTEYKAVLAFDEVRLGMDVEIRDSFIVGGGFRLGDISLPEIRKGDRLNIKYTFVGGSE
jgi:hypothetical protein